MNDKQVIAACRYEINKFRRDKLAALSQQEYVSVAKEAERIAYRLNLRTPRYPITIDNVLELMFAALYFEKFQESPLQTALATPPQTNERSL